LGTIGDFLKLWREKLCTVLSDVFALDRAVGLISEGYFDGHDVLFADSQKKLTSLKWAWRQARLGNTPSTNRTMQPTESCKPGTSDFACGLF
jgi:hypothetical protein